MIKCKVCRSEDLKVHSHVDTGTSCLRTVDFITGSSVTYYQCQECGLTFTFAFDEYTSDDWKTKVYNDSYIKYDPDYLDARPKSNAEFIRNFLMGGSLIAEPTVEMFKGMRILDYGGGNSVFGKTLKESLGVEVTSYDPYDISSEYPSGEYVLTTCFEVLEHTIDPMGTVKDLIQKSTGSVIVASTLLITPSTPIDWWYIAPRNGHVTIYSKTALDKLLDEYGYHCISIGGPLHVFIPRN